MKDYDLIVLLNSSLLQKIREESMKLFHKNAVLLTIHLAFLTELTFSGLKGQILLYRDTNLKVEERVKDLINIMTIEEKVNQMLKLNLADLKLDTDGKLQKILD